MPQRSWRTMLCATALAFLAAVAVAPTASASTRVTGSPHSTGVTASPGANHGD